MPSFQDPQFVFSVLPFSDEDLLGSTAAKRAKPVLDDLKNLVSQINDEKGVAAHWIRIGSFEVFTTHFLKPLLKTFPQEASLLLREVIPGEMESALLANEIDVGITYIPIPTAVVDHLKIATVKMGIYAKHGMFDRLPFPEVPFAIPVQPLKGTPNKVQGLDGWPDGKVARNVKYQVTLMESALELCRNGLAAAYLPSFVAYLHNQNVKTCDRTHSHRQERSSRFSREDHEKAGLHFQEIGEVSEAEYRFLSLEDVLELHEMQLAHYGGATGTRDFGLIESAVMMPQASFGGKYVHEGIYEMAAAYAFHIAENQPFVDGNKRTVLAVA